MDWTLTLLFAAVAYSGCWLVASSPGGLPDRTLRFAFALLIVGVAVYTFAGILTTLLAT